MNSDHVPHRKENLGNEKFMSEIEYNQKATEVWNRNVPETSSYEICSMREATHVVFTEIDLSLAGEEGESFTPYKIYPIGIEEESGDYYIIDDNNDIFIGFEMHIPCEFLKRKDSNQQNHRVLNKNSKVINISDYLHRKRVSNKLNNY